MRSCKILSSRQLSLHSVWKYMFEEDSYLLSNIWLSDNFFTHILRFVHDTCWLLCGMIEEVSYWLSSVLLSHNLFTHHILFISFSHAIIWHSVRCYILEDDSYLLVRIWAIWHFFTALLSIVHITQHVMTYIGRRYTIDWLPFGPMITC